MSELIPEAEGIEQAYQSLKERAKLATERNELELALQFSQEVLQLKPTDADVLVDLGNAHKALEQSEEAEKYYQEALIHNPYFWRALNNLGLIYAARKQYALALEFYERLSIVRESALIP